MTMNPTPRKLEKEDQDLIDEFFKNGGKVELLKKFQQSENIEYTSGFYGRGRKKKTQENKEDE